MDSATYWSGKHEAFGDVEMPLPLNPFAKTAKEHMSEGARVLNLGAGQGQDSLFFAQEGMRVTTTDVSPLGIELSRQRGQRAGVHMNYDVVDVREPLPYKDASFDVVFSNLGLHYFSSKKTREIFTEVARVLAGGGLFAVLMNAQGRTEIQEEGMELIEPFLYHDPKRGIQKLYTTPEHMEQLTEDLFTPLLCDAKGASPFKQGGPLVRYIGKKN